jgi:hypothetical protein
MVIMQSRRCGAWAKPLVGLAVAALAGLGGAGTALAVNGETPHSVGVYAVATEACNSLRTKTGVQGDALLACDRDGEACEIDLPNTDRETRSGIAATGVCSDDPSIDLPETVQGAIYDNAVIQGSKFSSITGVKANTGVDTEADNIACSTFTLSAPFTVGTGKSARVYGSGVRVCRKVVSCGSGNPNGPCPTPLPQFLTCSGEQANYFVTLQTDSCTDVQAILTGSVAPTAPNLSFALFTDFPSTEGDSVSMPGTQALVICPGYKAVCVNEGNRAQSNTVIDYRLPTAAVQQHCSYTKTDGTRITYNTTCPKKHTE